MGERSLSEVLTPSQYAKEQAQVRRDASRRDKFMECLKKDTVDIGETSLYTHSFQALNEYIVITADLRKLAWAGIPFEVRPIAWQLLLVSPPKLSIDSTLRIALTATTGIPSVCLFAACISTCAEAEGVRRCSRYGFLER